MITDWVDKVAEVWGTIDGGKGSKLKSFYVFKKAEFPESLNVFPSVLTIVPAMTKIQYSAGGPCVGIFEGESEFHLVPNASKGNLPYIHTFYEKIIVAAAANLQLGGAVEHFVLMAERPIRLGVLTYGNGDPHLGLVVRWSVKEIMTLTVSA